MAAWFNSETGELLRQYEIRAFERLTEQLFGFQLLQLGVLDELRPMLVDTQIKHQTLIGPDRQNDWQNYMVACADHLPVKSDSVDAVLLPHTLDVSIDPQKVLLEVERVLIPEGRIVLSGFNPFSLWGMVKPIKRKSASVPLQGHFVSYTRLHDWLSLLGFDVEASEVMMFRPPMQSISMMHKLEFMEKLGARLWPRFGGVYMIRAVKRVSTLTPVEPVWKKRPRLLSHVTEPTTRGMNRDA